MNNERRKQIDSVIKSLEELGNLIAKVNDLRQEISDEIESIKDDEQDYFDNMPESLQGGEKGQAAEGAIGIMDEVINSLSEIDIEQNIDDLVTLLDDAKHQ